MRNVSAFDLGPYEKVVQSAAKAMLLEPPWTLLVLGWRKRPAHSRRILLAASIVHVLAVTRTLEALKRSPSLIRDRAWVERRTLEMLIRYLAYPAIMPRRHYWRGHTGDVAFFMQTWGPVALWAAHGGVRSSLKAGILVGLSANIMAAWVNGEPIIPPEEVRNKVMSYTGACAAAGALAGLVARILADAASEMAEEQRLHAQATANRVAAREAAEIRMDGRARLRSALLRVGEQVQALSDQEDRRTLMVPVNDRLQAQWDQPDGSSLEDLIESTGRAFGVSVTSTIDVPNELTPDLADFLRYVLEVCLDNTKRHGHCGSASVSIVARGNVVTMHVLDRGTGLGEGFRLQPGHGLMHAGDYAELLGGTLIVAERKGGGVEVMAECQM